MTELIKPPEEILNAPVSNPNRESYYERIMRALPGEEERGKLVSLPYRIGLSVSHADTTGGWEAQEREMQTLTNILRAFAEDFCKSEFVQGLLLHTLAGRQDWVKWSHQLDEVPTECVAAVYDLQGALDAKELYAFKEIMMDIAVAVAQAFRENRPAEPEKTGFLQKILGGKKAQRFAHISISTDERAALVTIAESLDYEEK